MKRYLSILLAVLLLLGCLSGCGEKTSLDPDEPVTLTMWHVYGSQTESPLNDVIVEFNLTVGKEKGFIVDVVSVTDSSAIDEMLIASASNAPGSASLPNLFVAYPRIAEQIGTDKLLNWSDYFSDKELSAYIPGFLSEGYFDDQLLMLPIAKSTELLFLNKTLFDRFAQDTGVKAEDLSDFDRLFAACNSYYDWSDGLTMFQINDFYHYFLASMASMGGEFIVDGAINADCAEFEAAYLPMAEAAIHGGLCVGDGYASDRWKTGEVISNIGSSAGILYLRDYVTYSDNTTLDIETTVFPYPTFSEMAPTVVQRGGGLFAIKSEDARINEAASVFAKWVTTGQPNLDFVTKAGYLPATAEAFELLFSDTSIVENEKYRMLYETVGGVYNAYDFRALPLYDGSGSVQSAFEKTMKSVLLAAHEEYVSRMERGEDSNVVMQELTSATLAEIRNAVSRK